MRARKWLGTKIMIFILFFTKKLYMRKIISWNFLIISFQFQHFSFHFILRHFHFDIKSPILLSFCIFYDSRECDIFHQGDIRGEICEIFVFCNWLILSINVFSSKQLSGYNRLFPEKKQCFYIVNAILLGSKSIDIAMQKHWYHSMKALTLDRRGCFIGLQRHKCTPKRAYRLEQNKNTKGKQIFRFAYLLCLLDALFSAITWWKAVPLWHAVAEGPHPSPPSLGCWGQECLVRAACFRGSCPLLSGSRW